jgi:hypothetical protein
MRTASPNWLASPHDRRLQPLIRRGRRGYQRRRLRRAGRFGLHPGRTRRPAHLDRGADRGKPHGSTCSSRISSSPATRGHLVASLRAQIPAGHLAFVAGLLDGYGIPDAPPVAEHDEIAASLNPDGAAALLDVTFRRPIALIANALGSPPPGLVDRARTQGVAVAALVGQPRHAVRQIEAGIDVLIAQGTEAGGHTGIIAIMVLTPEIVDIAAGRPVLAAGRHRVRSSDGRRAGPRRGQRVVRVGVAQQRGGRRQPGHQGQVPARHQFGHAALADQDRQARPPAAQRLARGVGAAGQPAPLPMPLQPMLVNEAWQRIDVAARAGHEGALRLESFFIGQVVGSFEDFRPADEIIWQMVAECEQQIAELADLALGPNS